MLRYASRAARDLLKVREDVVEASASEAVANEYLRSILDAAESLQEAPRALSRLEVSARIPFPLLQEIPDFLPNYAGGGCGGTHSACRTAAIRIVKRFDAALVGGGPHRRHLASLGIPSVRVFTDYDAVDNEYFARRAEVVRAANYGR